MTLPSFNAEQSLYRSSAHYRALALASAVGGIRPSTTGTYKQTCNLSSCIYYPQYDSLCCDCLDRCGNYIRDCVPNVSKCQSDIANCNGHLKCGAC
jgi:hypothetical protein